MRIRQTLGAGRGAWTLRGFGGFGLVLAAALRLARLDLVEFRADEAATMRRAEDLVRLGRLPLEGPRSSQGLSLEPHFAYLLAPFVAISRDPAVATGAVAAANIGAVGGTLWLGSRGFGPLAGIVAACLYAASPSAVFYSRKIWEPELHPPIAVLLFVALERGVLEGRAWWAAATLRLPREAAAPQRPGPGGGWFLRTAW